MYTNILSLQKLMLILKYLEICCFEKNRPWRMEIDRALRKHLKCDQRVPLVNYDFHFKSTIWPFPLNFGRIISSLSKFNNTLVRMLKVDSNKIWQTHQHRLINVYLVCLWNSKKKNEILRLTPNNQLIVLTSIVSVMFIFGIYHFIQIIIHHTFSMVKLFIFSIKFAWGLWWNAICA